MKFVAIIIPVCIVLYMIYRGYKEYKKSETIDEKILFWVLLMIVLVPTIIYYIDRSDLPSHLGWVKHTDSERWFSFITTYVSAIMGSIIGAIALILMTVHEFKIIKENDNEQRRINNMPLIDYYFSVHYDYDAPYVIHLPESKKHRHLFVRIIVKNISTHIIRKCYVNIKSDLIKDNYDYKIDTQTLIKSQEHKELVFNIPISKGRNKISFIVKYQDALFNWYEQEVILTLDNIRKSEKEYNAWADQTVEVKDEKVIRKEIELNIK